MVEMNHLRLRNDSLGGCTDRDIGDAGRMYGFGDWEDARIPNLHGGQVVDQADAHL